MKMPRGAHVQLPYGYVPVMAESRTRYSGVTYLLWRSHVPVTAGSRTGYGGVRNLL